MVDQAEFTSAHIDIPMEKIKDFCRRWKIAEVSLFGSVLRDDFHPESDIDMLVRFAPDEHWSLLDLVRMENELKKLFRRNVDLVEEICIENPFRRKEIIETKEVIYAT